MRIWRNAIGIGRIAGFGAFGRTLRKGGILALAAEIDTLVALLQLWRHRLLSLLKK